MDFTVTLYMSIEADNEAEARKIADSLRIDSPYKEQINWNAMNTEVEEEPDL